VSTSPILFFGLGHLFDYCDPLQRRDASRILARHTYRAKLLWAEIWRIVPLRCIGCTSPRLFLTRGDPNWRRPAAGAGGGDGGRGAQGGPQQGLEVPELQLHRLRKLPEGRLDSPQPYCIPPTHLLPLTTRLRMHVHAHAKALLLLVHSLTHLSLPVHRLVSPSSLHRPRPALIPTPTRLYPRPLRPPRPPRLPRPLGHVTRLNLLIA
jgi:hypothetical protein